MFSRCYDDFQGVIIPEITPHTITIVQGLQEPLQLALEVLLHLQRTGEDLEGELAIVVEQFVIGLGLLEPLGLPELVLIGSGNRRAVKREEESVGKVRMRDG